MSDSIFETTIIDGLATGLQVRHIATTDQELRTCKIDDKRDLAAIFADPQFHGFDQIPVREGDSIVGVISKGSTGNIEDNLQRLSESNLIPAQEPLTDLIPLMAKTSYRFVLQGASIAGIVTRSDLLKLPVRLFIFSLVAHLELLMSDIIRARYPDSQDTDEWSSLLKTKRQIKIKAKQQKLAQGNRELPLLECTDFCDKRDIVRKIGGFSEKFERELDSIERNLRNKVAHAGDYAQNDEQMHRFIDRVQWAENNISKLQSLLSKIRGNNLP